MNRLRQICRDFRRSEAGITFMETLIALVILGVVSVTFINGLTTASKSAFLADKKTTAESLAQSQMEWVKDSSYSYDATTYSPAPIPSGKDYQNYSAVITAEPLNNPDDGIQKITVYVHRFGENIFYLKGYKLDR